MSSLKNALEFGDAPALLLLALVERQPLSLG